MCFSNSSNKRLHIVYGLQKVGDTEYSCIHSDSVGKEKLLIRTLLMEWLV